LNLKEVTFSRYSNTKTGEKLLYSEPVPCPWHFLIYSDYFAPISGKSQTL